MNRHNAFGIATECLNLAQDLSGHALLRNPDNLKDDLSCEELIEELKISHQALAKAAEAAYSLDRKITEWANEYPLIKEELA